MPPFLLLARMCTCPGRTGSMPPALFPPAKLPLSCPAPLPAVPLGVSPQLKTIPARRRPHPPSPCRPPLTECPHSNHHCIRHHHFPVTSTPPQPNVPALNRGLSAAAKVALQPPPAFQGASLPTPSQPLTYSRPFPQHSSFLPCQHCFSPAPAPPLAYGGPPQCCCTRHVAFCLEFISPFPLPLIPPAFPHASRALSLPLSLFSRAAGCELIAHAVLQPPVLAPGRPAIAGQYPALHCMHVQVHSLPALA